MVNCSMSLMRRDMLFKRDILRAIYSLCSCDMRCEATRYGNIPTALRKQHIAFTAGKHIEIAQ